VNGGMVRRQRSIDSSACGEGLATWSRVAMLSSCDYLDGVIGRLNLLVPFASKSICFRALY
jgi:hypothetical protein